MLAEAIAVDLPEYQLVHMDDLYRGWDGLEAGSKLVPALLLNSPVRTWNWQTGDTTGPWLELDPERPVIVEGCGALTRGARFLADFGIWIDLDEVTRKQRALRRDPAFAAHWDAWARQEDAHIVAEAPTFLADLPIFATPDTDVTRWRSLIDPERVEP